MTDVERFRQITSEMADLYEKKNKNYGNSFEKLFSDLGPVSGLVPLHNKLDRATNLVRGGHNDFESLEDTIMDLANYAIMMYMELQKAREADPAEVAKERDLADYRYSSVAIDTPNIEYDTTISGNNIAYDVSSIYTEE